MLGRLRTSFDPGTDAKAPCVSLRGHDQKALSHPLLSVMAWPAGERTMGQAVKLTAQRLSGNAGPVLRPQPLTEIEQTPPQDVMDRGGSDRSRWPLLVPCDVSRAAEVWPGRAAIDQAVWPFSC